MTRFRKVLRYIALVVGLFVLVVGMPLALVLSHDSACTAAPHLRADATVMKGIAYRCYGSPDVLKLEDIEKPVAGDDQVLVKVHAAAVNPLDFHYMHGTPYLMRLDSGIGTPKNARLGVDFAGTIEAVGKNVKKFKPGDEVFGGRNGAFGEYVTVREDRSLVLKPANMTFEQAAAVPIAAITALQALRDNGHIQAGQKVLINGASGGVGTFAVQLAKSFGAEVTGVCSTKNLDMVRKIGADHVIDYTKEDFTQGDQHYDLIVDMVGTHSLLDYKRVLTPQGNLVMVGGQVDNWLLGILGSVVYAKMLSPFISQKFGMMLAELNPDDLTTLRDLMQAGKITPVIDRTYKLSEVPDALRYLERGHARGKVVISVVDDSKS
ncbi:MAG TPA: NAD(P)-dependent alcohol dehydrogenase [Rudaea sp.]|jgi:NADPH:quinone reductase-like Zn-dependent oxidoreductase